MVETPYLTSQRYSPICFKSLSIISCGWRPVPVDKCSLKCTLSKRMSVLAKRII